MLFNKFGLLLLFGNDLLFVISKNEGYKGRHIRQGSAVSPLWESGHVLTAILAIKEDWNGYLACDVYADGYLAFTFWNKD